MLSLVSTRFWPFGAAQLLDMFKLMRKKLIFAIILPLNWSPFNKFDVIGATISKLDLIFQL